MNTIFRLVFLHSWTHVASKKTDPTFTFTLPSPPSFGDLIPPPEISSLLGICLNVSVQKELISRKYLNFRKWILWLFFSSAVFALSEFSGGEVLRVEAAPRNHGRCLENYQIRWAKTIATFHRWLITLNRGLKWAQSTLSNFETLKISEFGMFSVFFSGRNTNLWSTSRLSNSPVLVETSTNMTLRASKILQDSIFGRKFCISVR